MNPATLLFIKDHAAEIALTAVVVGLLAFVGIKTIQCETLKADLADAQRQNSELISKHERVSRELATERANVQSAHAAGQLEKEQEYAQERQRQADARAADRRERDRLRDTIRTYAAGGRAAGAVDAAPAVDQADRLDRLAALLDEGVELALEGRGVVERRDAEVKRLLGQIGLDRAACEARPAQ